MASKLYGAVAVPQRYLTAGEIERGAKMLHELSASRQAEVAAAMAQQSAQKPEPEPEISGPESQAGGALW